MNLFRRIYVLIIFNFRTFSDSLVQKMPIKGLKNTGKLDFRQETYPRRGPGSIYILPFITDPKPQNASKVWD